MALACQQNSYLKELSAKVVSCKPAQVTIVHNGKKNKVQCHEIILEDTVLFPEGGGQPDDRGLIGEAKVIKVERRGATAVHYATGEVTPGSEVSLKVDWERRFDHMQQHTAQHLITAVTDHLYGYKTTSWSLGETIVTIELDTPTLSQEQLVTIETEVNEKIRQQIPVTPHLYTDKHDPKLQQFRARGLPDDHEGPVRVLDIEGVDGTLCCGTHVSNLAHLQMVSQLIGKPFMLHHINRALHRRVIPDGCLKAYTQFLCADEVLKCVPAIKILGCEKGKKNKTNLTFVAGGRLLNYFGRSYQVERELTGILSGPLDKHTELADKAVKGFKQNQKMTQALLKEVALLEAEVYKAKPDKEPVFCHFRKGGDSEYMSTLVGQILADNPETVVMVCVGTDDTGIITLAGPPDVVAHMGPKMVCQHFGSPFALHHINQALHKRVIPLSMPQSPHISLCAGEILKVAEVLEAKGAVTGGRYRGKVNKLSQRIKAERLLQDYVQSLRQGTGDSQAES